VKTNFIIKSNSSSSSSSSSCLFRPPPMPLMSVDVSLHLESISLSLLSVRRSIHVYLWGLVKRPLLRRRGGCDFK